MPDALFACINSIKKTTISMPFIGKCIPSQEGHDVPPVTKKVYQTFNRIFNSVFTQHKVSHANRYERVKNDCNSYSAGVCLSQRRTAIFFTALNANKGGEKQCI